MLRDKDKAERRSRSRSPRRQKPHDSPRPTRRSDDSPHVEQPNRSRDQRDTTRPDARGRYRSRSPRRSGGGVKGRSRSRSAGAKGRSKSRSRSRSRSPVRKRRKSGSRSRSESPARKRRRSRSDSRDRHRRDRKRSRSRSRSRSKDRGGRKRSRSRSRERRKEKKREKKEKKEKKKEKKHGQGSAAQWGKYGIISDVDIFTKGPEFYAWLVEERKINPETITKDQNKKEFAKFAEDFNTATLPHEKYYHMEAYERRMSALRQGEFVPPPDDTYDPQADMKAISGAHKKKVVEHESYLSKEQLQELRRVQHERIEAGKMKLLGMDVKQNMGVRMDGTMFDG